MTSLIIKAYSSTPQAARHTQSGLCVLLLSVLVIMGAQASSPALRDKGELFLPDSFNYYNPLKHGAVKTSRAADPHALDNQQLEAAASYIRANEMSAEQRALNHQWLSQTGDSNIRIGNKVLSSIMRMGFKTYWTGVRNKHYKSTAMPDGNGNGQLTEEVEYKLRLSQDKVRLVLKYDF